MMCEPSFLELRIELGPDRRIDDAWVHRVHSNWPAALGALECDTLGEDSYATFGCVVGRKVGGTLEASDR